MLMVDLRMWEGGDRVGRLEEGEWISESGGVQVGGKVKRCWLMEIIRFNRIFIFNNFNPQPIGIIHFPNNLTGFKFILFNANFLRS